MGLTYKELLTIYEMEKKYGHDKNVRKEIKRRIDEIERMDKLRKQIEEEVRNGEWD